MTRSFCGAFCAQLKSRLLQSPDESLHCHDVDKEFSNAIALEIRDGSSSLSGRLAGIVFLKEIIESELSFSIFVDTKQSLLCLEKLGS